MDHSSAMGSNAAFKRETVSHFIDHGGNTSVGYAGTETSPIAPSLHGSPASIDLRSSCAGKSEMCRNSRSVASASSIDSTETSTRTPDAFARSSHLFPSKRGISSASRSICASTDAASFASTCVHAKKHNPSSAAERNSTPAPSAAHAAANVALFTESSPPNRRLVNARSRSDENVDRICNASQMSRTLVSDSNKFRVFGNDGRPAYFQRRGSIGLPSGISNAESMSAPACCSCSTTSLMESASRDSSVRTLASASRTLVHTTAMDSTTSANATRPVVGSIFKDTPLVVLRRSSNRRRQF